MELTIVNLSDNIPLKIYVDYLVKIGVLNYSNINVNKLHSNGYCWETIDINCDNDFPMTIINSIKKRFNIGTYILDLADNVLYIDDFDENNLAISLESYINQHD